MDGLLGPGICTFSLGGKKCRSGCLASRGALTDLPQFDFESAVQCRRGPFQRADRHRWIARVKEPIHAARLVFMRRAIAIFVRRSRFISMAT